MTNEQAAAERLRNSEVAGIAHREIYGYDEEHDLAILGRAYLTEHRADDFTPVDADWLRSVGFRRKQYQGQDVLALSIPDPCGTSQWIETGPATYSHGLFDLRRWDDDDEEMPPDCVTVKAKTRGDVRRLCRALGITMEEKTNG